MSIGNAFVRSFSKLLQQYAGKPLPLATIVEAIGTPLFVALLREGVIEQTTDQLDPALSPDDGLCTPRMQSDGPRVSISIDGTVRFLRRLLRVSGAGARDRLGEVHELGTVAWVDGPREAVLVVGDATPSVIEALARRATTRRLSWWFPDAPARPGGP
jgi:hypothetical protein